MKSSISKRQLQKALHVLQDYSKEVDEFEAKVLEKSLFDENKIWISEVFQQVKSLVSGENNLSVLKENDLEEVPVLLPKTRKGKKKALNKVSEEAIVEEKEIEDSSSNEKKGIEQKSPTFTKPMVQVSDDTKKSLRDLNKDNINNEPSLRCLKSSSEIDSRSIHEGNLPEQNSERDSISSVEIESCPKYEDTLPGQNNKNDSVKSAEIDSRSIHEDTLPEQNNIRDSINSAEIDSRSIHEDNLPEQNNIRDSINSADIDNGSIHEDTLPEQNSKKDSICSADSQSRSIHEDTLSEENSKRESLSSAVIDSQSIHEDTLSKENSKRDSISSAEIDNCSINEGTLPEQNINCNTTFNVPSNSHIEKQASNILIDSNQSTRSIIQSKDKSHSTTPSSSKISSKVNVKDPPKENVAPSSNNNNALYPHLSVKELTSREETDIKKSKSATNQEEKDKRKSARRSSLCQYKGLVNKAIRTSISAEQKKNKTNEDRENVIFNKYSTPLNETRKIPRTVSATTSSGMKTATLPRTHSLLRHRSPYPIKMPSVISSSSKSFFVIKIGIQTYYKNW
ncbi:uncharacterized protein [Lepeophtheirus salmonis]|uniref:uncharacterized protein n=1 Tax=Lepeophtheirus salmonis TaxID=72036 RepID=UPI001AE2AF75|nr:uncharacterized protein LOC121116042 [Lepeophtheirus salmonis]